VLAKFQMDMAGRLLWPECSAWQAPRL